MTSLSKKVLVVAFMGISALGVTSLIPRWSGAERQHEALVRLDADCRAYRSAPLHHNAEVCRTYDIYAPHTTHLLPAIDRHIEWAKLAAVRGDHHAAELALRGVLETLPQIDAVGTRSASLIGASAINRTLSVLEAYPSLDRAFVLHDVQFALLRRPLEGDTLQRRWAIARQEKLSASEAADKMDQVEKAAREMERAASRFDEAACKAADPAADPDFCNRLVTLARTSARLDAMRR